MLTTAVGDEGDVGPGASCFHNRDLRLFMATALKGPGPHQVAGCEPELQTPGSARGPPHLPPGARGASLNPVPPATNRARRLAGVGSVLANRKPGRGRDFPFKLHNTLPLPSGGKVGELQLCSAWSCAEAQRRLLACGSCTLGWSKVKEIQPRPVLISPGSPLPPIRESFIG